MSSHLYWGIETPPQYHECLLLLGRQIRRFSTKKGVGIGRGVSDSSQRPDIGAIDKEDEKTHQYCPEPGAACGRMQQ